MLPDSIISASNTTSPRDSSAETKWTPPTKSEARALLRSQLPPGAAAVRPLVTRPPMPKSEINRLARKIGRENTLQRILNYIASAAPGSSPARRNSARRAGSASSSAKWTPLTESEARAIIQECKLHPNRYPSFSSPSPQLRAADATARPPMPQSEIDRLARKIGRENILQRTLHYIPAHVVPGPAKPDQRILHAHRRMSYRMNSGAMGRRCGRCAAFELSKFQQPL